VHWQSNNESLPSADMLLIGHGLQLYVFAKLCKARYSIHEFSGHLHSKTDKLPASEMLFAGHGLHKENLWFSSS
jgi:hypothetical protein